MTDYTIDYNLKKMKEDLLDYGVDYDLWFSEQSLYDTKQVDRTLERLKESGELYEKEGAVWFRSTDYGLEKDDVLIRANGLPTYFLSDIAYHLNKLEKRGFDRAVDVWGADHYGHVERLKRALEAAGYKDKLDIILMQLVQLKKSDKIVRLSKRAGEIITLSDIVSEIGIDASRFFFNMRSPSSHFELDLDLAVKESNDNPVFYVQYAHARISSILRHLESKLTENMEDADLSLLKTPEEKELINTLSLFPEEIIIAENSMDPSRIIHYAIDLASAFHTFYNACRVNTEDIELARARTALVQATKQVLENISLILGIQAPERM